MSGELLRFAGGLGLFLLGMVVMTEGLRALAGDALNRVLFRFTKSPLTGALSGAGVTALVQSSSATTVATVGFVSAGLLTFSQALGIVFGANIGTTATGWLVALVGFKLSLGTALLPFLLLGLLLRLFARGRVRQVGWAVAGFALIFVAIEQMRAGMEPFADVFTPEAFPADTLGGRFLLLAIGAGITLVTQSSSAGVAMALTALNAGAIGFPQAAALVIGMDVGTTSSSALATVGGSPQTRRTGFSHVFYNLLTGLGALLILPLYIGAVDRWVGAATTANPELALVGFHTAFNTLGVVAVLPFANRFAALMYRLIPDSGPQLTRRLDSTLIQDASASTAALWQTVRDLTDAVFQIAVERLETGTADAQSETRAAELEQAIAETRRFADLIPNPLERARDPDLRVASMHCLDHLDRLIDRCRQADRAVVAFREPRLRQLASELAKGLEAVRASLAAEEAVPPEALVKEVRNRLRAERQPYRIETLEKVGENLHLDAALRRLDAVRWLHRTAYHAWRITHHLSGAERRQERNAHDLEIAPRAEHDPSEMD